LTTLRFSRAAVLCAGAAAFACVSACGPTSGGSRRTTAPSSAVVATIPIGDYGSDVAVRADGARVYVPLRTGKVAVIDAVTRRVAATIETGGQPYAIALARDGRRGYVADMTAQDVFVLDTASDRLAASVPAGIVARPLMTPAVAVSGDGRRAYVVEATAKGDHLLVIETAANTIVDDHVLPIHPAGVAAAPDGRTVYVAGCKLACIDGTLLAVDGATGKVVSTVGFPAAPAALALAPDGSRAYVPNARAATVTAIDLAGGAVTTAAVDVEPTGIAADPRAPFVYVTSFGAASVSAIDTRTMTVVRTFAVDRSPRAIAVSPDGRFAYVTHSAPTVSVLELARPGGATR
jgi:YVTN family beta-propeller protein